MTVSRLRQGAYRSRLRSLEAGALCDTVIGDMSDQVRTASSGTRSGAISADAMGFGLQLEQELEHTTIKELANLMTLEYVEVGD